MIRRILLKVESKSVQENSPNYDWKDFIKTPEFKFFLERFLVSWREQ